MPIEAPPIIAPPPGKPEGQGDQQAPRAPESVLRREDVINIVKIHDIVRDFNEGIKSREKTRAEAQKASKANSWSSKASDFLEAKIGKPFTWSKERYTKMQKDFYLGDGDKMRDLGYRGAWGVSTFLVSPLFGPVLGPFVMAKGLKDAFEAFTERRALSKDMAGPNHLNADSVKYTQDAISRSLSSILTELRESLVEGEITPDEYYMLVKETIKDHNQWIEEELLPKERNLTTAQNQLQEKLGKAGKIAALATVFYGGINPLSFPAAGFVAMHANAQARNQKGVVPEDGEDTAKYLIKNPIIQETPAEMVAKAEEENRTPIELADFLERAKQPSQPGLTQRLTQAYPELHPTSRIEVNGSNFFLGPTFADPTGATYSVFYVQAPGGKLITRLARRDQLNGSWHAVEGLEVPRSGKGGGGDQQKSNFSLVKPSIHPIEETLLPVAVSNSLEATESKQGDIAGFSKDTVKNLLKDNFAKVQRKEDRSGIVKPEIKPENETYRDEISRFDDKGVLERLRITKPDNLKLFDPEKPRDGGVPLELGLDGLILGVNGIFNDHPGLAPNFAEAPRERYTRSHPFFGKIEVEVYAGQLNGATVMWHMAHDAAGRIWVDRLQLEQSKTTTYGTVSKVIDAGFLTLQPLVHQEKGNNKPAQTGQEKGKYSLIERHMQKVPGARDGVQDVTQFLDELTPIAAYRMHRDIHRVAVPDEPEKPEREDKKKKDKDREKAERSEEDRGEGSKKSGKGENPERAERPERSEKKEPVVVPENKKVENAAEQPKGGKKDDDESGGDAGSAGGLPPAPIGDPPNSPAGGASPSGLEPKIGSGNPVETTENPSILEGQTGRRLIESLYNLQSNKQYEAREMLRSRINRADSMMLGRWRDRQDGHRLAFSKLLAENAQKVSGLSPSDPRYETEVTEIAGFLCDAANAASLFGFSYRANELRNEPEARCSLILRGVVRLSAVARSIRAELPKGSPIRNAYHSLVVQIERLIEGYQSGGVELSEIADSPEKLAEQIAVIREEMERTATTPRPTQQSVSGVTPSPLPTASQSQSTTAPIAQVVANPGTPSQATATPEANPQPAPPSIGRFEALVRQNPIYNQQLTPLERGYREKALKYVESLSAVPKAMQEAATPEQLQDLCRKITKQDNRVFEGADLVRTLRVLATGIASLESTKRRVGVHDEMIETLLTKALDIEKNLPTDPTQTARTAQNVHASQTVTDLGDQPI